MHKKYIAFMLFVSASVAAGVIAAIFALSGSSDEPLVRWTGFTDKTDGFKMECPDALQFVRSPYGVSCTGGFGSHIASVTVLETRAATPAEWFEDYRRAQDYIPLTMTETTFAGKPAYRASQEGEAPGAYRYFVVHEGRSYEIGHSLPPDQAARFEGGFKFLETYAPRPSVE